MSSMEFPPVQTTSFPDSGGVAGSGTQKRSEEKGEGTAEMEVKEKKKEGSPSIKLGLGIEEITAEKPVMKHGKHVFTTAQLDELRLQALIYQYIACGIAVPFHLVMPIWESVASSFGSSSGNGGIYHHYPSLIGARPQGFIYRNMMDPEPGRCRRTDGKKWRCSKNVIPDQKYCEQHMHRGRQRSRKLVESSQSTLSDMKSMKNSNKESDNSQNLSVPVSFQYMKQSSSNISANLEAATATDSNNARSNRSFIPCIATTSTMVNSATDKKKNHCKRFKHFPITSEKGEEKLSVSDSSIINRSSKNGNSATVGHSVSSGVGFSPKSVLPVLGCSSSHVCKNDIEAEPGRCRRTDGKKWRCSRDVIPDQKYCARHMHRGAKKHVVVSQLAAIPSVGDCPSSRSTIANKAACAALNTSLSISTPSPHLTTHDEKSSTSNSETTISDTNINV